MAQKGHMPPFQTQKKEKGRNYAENFKTTKGIIYIRLMLKEYGEV